jgi:hypothetical protein
MHGGGCDCYVLYEILDFGYTDSWMGIGLIVVCTMIYLYTLRLDDAD